MKHIVLVAGGSGGHLFPALATAKAIIQKHLGCEVTLYTDKKGADESVRWQTFFLPRKNNKLALPVFVFMLIYQFIAHLFKFLWRRPDIAVGFGGYPSVPVMLAAQLLGIPTILHEQNAFLGKANRILAKKSKRIALTFSKTQALPNDIQSVVTGNPVRFSQISSYQLKEKNIHLFVFGGSQGAHVFSKLVPQSLDLLPKDIQSQITVTQQCRPEDIDAAKEQYKNLGIAAELASFFKDILKEYEKADIVIARAGSSTISELTVAGRASILIPYPYAMDDHQYHNAKAIEDACFLYRQKDIDAGRLSSILLKLIEDRELRLEKAKALQKYSMRDAAEKLAGVILEA